MIPILYEDEIWLALDKPAGMPSVPLRDDETGTAVNAAVALRPILAGVGESLRDPRQRPRNEAGLLNRLDTSTSGILLFAKSPAEFARLRDLWKTREVAKLYRAWARGAVPAPQTIDFPLGHSAKSGKRMIPVRDERDLRKIRGNAREARTEIVECRGRGADASDLLIRIEAGVLHQIRCHLAAAGHPLVGDPIYGERVAAAEREFWLHAWRLELPGRTGRGLRSKLRCLRVGILVLPSAARRFAHFLCASLSGYFAKGLTGFWESFRGRVRGVFKSRYESLGGVRQTRSIAWIYFSSWAIFWAMESARGALENACYALSRPSPTPISKPKIQSGVPNGFSKDGRNGRNVCPGTCPPVRATKSTPET